MVLPSATASASSPRRGSQPKSNKLASSTCSSGSSSGDDDEEVSRLMSQAVWTVDQGDRDQERELVRIEEQER